MFEVLKFLRHRSNAGWAKRQLVCVQGRFWLFVPLIISRVGQNHIFTVYIRYFWQGNHLIYGHIRCIHTVLANPKHSTEQVGVKLARTTHIRYKHSVSGREITKYTVIYGVHLLFWLTLQVGHNGHWNTMVAGTLFLGLARTVYIRRIWPSIWWFPCKKYRIYTVHTWFWPSLLT